MASGRMRRTYLNPKTACTSMTDADRYREERARIMREIHRPIDVCHSRYDPCPRCQGKDRAATGWSYAICASCGKIYSHAPNGNGRGTQTKVRRSKASQVKATIAKIVS